MDADTAQTTHPAHTPHTGHGPAGHGHGTGSGHGHGHGTGTGHGHEHLDTDIDWAALAGQLVANGELQLPVLRSAAERLRDLLGPRTGPVRILDVGSGPGVMTCVLAEAFPGAEVVAVDGTPALLEHALERAAELGLGDRVRVRQAELPGDLAALGGADLIWSSKAVHHVGDQQGALDALAALLRPGGVLAVAETGLPMRYLPRDLRHGRPGLQSRLDAVYEEWFEAMRTSLPGSTPVLEDWTGMLGAAGLGPVGAFTALLDLPAPLGGDARAFLLDYLTRLRDRLSGELDEADMATMALLTDPQAPEGILHRPDAFLLSATTVHTGVRA
ncbi:class I SAM-dependent methyltransferase [Streptomyces sp. NPDC089919]|uniref:class I SAM-dependent methyltransferase n=1 Tax=Streptomyces sp. NPDC089919 TaxID=3155188 RepID=UPI00343BB4D2